MQKSRGGKRSGTMERARCFPQDYASTGNIPRTEKKSRFAVIQSLTVRYIVTGCKFEFRQPVDINFWFKFGWARMHIFFVDVAWPCSVHERSNLRRRIVPGKRIVFVKIPNYSIIDTRGFALSSHYNAFLENKLVLTLLVPE